MEAWAQRILDLLQKGRAEGRSQKALAQACGLSQPSVSQWFSDSGNKPATQMIMGDNLVAAARYLGTTPEYIMTGIAPDSSSHQMGLDPEILSAAIKLVRLTFTILGVDHDPESDGVPTALAYRYLISRQERSVSGDVLIDFSQYLKRRMQEAEQNDEGVDGVGGLGAGHRGTRARRRAG